MSQRGLWNPQPNESQVPAAPPEPSNRFTDKDVFHPPDIMAVVEAIGTVSGSGTPVSGVIEPRQAPSTPGLVPAAS